MNSQIHSGHRIKFYYLKNQIKLMVKGQQSPLILVVLLLLFIGIIFLLKKPETPAPTTTSTLAVTTTSTVPSTTTTTPIVTTTTLASKCTGTNNRACAYGTKFDCTIAKCCYWDLNTSKCKIKQCSDVSDDFCLSCGCNLAQ